MTLVEVRTWRHARDLRRVRNACLDFMTGDRRRVSLCRQWRWWRKLPRTTKAYIGYLHDKPIAFGVVRQRYPHSSVRTISGGILPQFRGLGLGRQLFGFLSEQAGDGAELEVFAWNRPARRLYTSLGWKWYLTHGDIVHMRLSRSSQWLPSPAKSEPPDGTPLTTSVSS